MRLLHVLSSLDYQTGGPFASVIRFCSMTQGLGVDCDVLGVGTLNAPDASLGRTQIYAFPLGRLAKYRYSPGVRSWCRDNLKYYDAAILHGVWDYPIWAVGRECRRQGLPYGLHPHGMLEPWAMFRQGLGSLVKKSLYWLLMERLTAKGAAVLYYSTARERDRSARLPFLGDQCSILAGYGVSASNGKIDDQTLAGTPRTDPAPYALFLGRLHRHKNVGILLDAWAAAGSLRPWRLVIAGPDDNEYATTLKAQAFRLGIADSVVFVGSVYGKAKSDILRGAKWFVLPSAHENFGIAVVEAAEANCAVAVSEEVYVSDYFPSLPREVLPTTVAAWTDFFLKRMRDPTHMVAVAESTHRQLLTNLGSDQVAKAWAQAADVLAKSGGRSIAAART